MSEHNERRSDSCEDKLSRGHLTGESVWLGESVLVKELGDRAKRGEALLSELLEIAEAKR